MKWILLILALSQFQLTEAQEWSSSRIRPDLLKNADAVVRQNETTIDILSDEKVIVKKTTVITVLNPNGRDYARCYLVSDGFSRVTIADGFLYDATGKQVKTIHQKDFYKILVSMFSNEYSDDVIKFHDFSYGAYPYTVVYTTVTEQYHTFMFPAWQPQPSGKCALEMAVLKVTAPDALELRSVTENISSSGSGGNGANKMLIWNCSDIHAFRESNLLDAPNHGLPIVLIVTGKFNLDGRKGDMSSWGNFSTFMYQLNKGRDSLSVATERTVHELTDTIVSVKDKISRIYRYMQQTTRYVAVEYGIGGWQTMKASFVATNGYGDCKGLSNYMMALLKVANILSYPVIIWGGDDNPVPASNDFTANHFNHEILCVPLKNDTVWLECTAQQLPAGFLSNFTHNRKGLMIAEKGGGLIGTPLYSETTNRLQRFSHLTLGDDGYLNANISCKYYGDQAGHLAQAIPRLSHKDLEDYTRSMLFLQSYLADDYAFFDTTENDLPVFVENIAIRAAGHIINAAPRKIINMNVVPLQIQTPDLTDSAIAFRFSEAFETKDSFVLEVPPGYKVESQPSAVDLQFPFGSYSMNFICTGNQVICKRVMIMRLGSYTSDQWSNYLHFITTMNNSSGQRIVLINAGD